MSPDELRAAVRAALRNAVKQQAAEVRARAVGAEPSSPSALPARLRCWLGLHDWTQGRYVIYCRRCWTPK